MSIKSKILTRSAIVIDTHKTVFNSLVPVPVPFPFPDSSFSIRPKFDACVSRSLASELQQIVVVGSVTLGSKVTFSGSRTAFTLRSRRSRF